MINNDKVDEGREVSKIAAVVYSTVVVILVGKIIIITTTTGLTHKNTYFVYTYRMLGHQRVTYSCYFLYSFPYAFLKLFCLMNCL